MGRLLRWCAARSVGGWRLLHILIVYLLNLNGRGVFSTVTTAHTLLHVFHGLVQLVRFFSLSTTFDHTIAIHSLWVLLFDRLSRNSLLLLKLLPFHERKRSWDNYTRKLRLAWAFTPPSRALQWQHFLRFLWVWGSLNVGGCRSRHFDI